MVKATSGLILAAAIVTTAAWAHHPFESEFDSGKPVTLTGTITSVSWTEPRVMIHADVKEGDAKGAWNLEAASPQEMKRYGWTKDMLRAGATFTAHAYLARIEKQTASARSVKVGDAEMSTAAHDGGPMK